MTRAAVLGPDWLCAAVAREGGRSHLADIAAPRDSETSGGLRAWLEHAAVDAVVYYAADATCVPDEEAARPIWSACRDAHVSTVVVVSSAAVYGAVPHNPGLMTEQRAMSTPAHRIAAAWQAFERAALRHFHGTRTAVAVLRPAATLTPQSRDCFSRLLSSPIACTLPGHDPTIQLLSPGDLAAAICHAIDRRADGVFNVAPDEPITLRAAVRLAGRWRAPVPYVLRRLARGRDESAVLDYLRYSWTVSNAKAKRDLGFVPEYSSAAAVAALNPQSSPARGVAPRFDPFGLDERYIAWFGRTVLRFLERCYWRMEIAGLEHVPRGGRAVLVGMHRGFMPLDGVMTLHVVAQGTGRIPRFLIHPAVGLRFPFLSNFMTKFGGMIACRENATYALSREDLLGIYPEGIRGAFTPYRRAYQVGPSWRDDFVKIALRHQAPIIPFVTVGSAEIFPIFGRIHWRWWKRYTGWPFIPLTPTFPLLPIPLPSKWHTQFLPPIHLERTLPPEAADDAAVVARISETVKQQIEHAAHAMLQRRPSIFFGSVFPEPALRERTT